MNIFLTKFLIIGGSIAIAVGSFASGTWQMRALSLLYLVANFIIFVFK